MEKLLNLQSEESNYSVLKKVIIALHNGENRNEMAKCLEEFLKPKDRIATEIEKLTIKARHGDDEAAKQLIIKLAEENDGP